MERDFFGSTFRPFYRTEQIIITTKKLDTISGGKKLKYSSLHSNQIKLLFSQVYLWYILPKSSFFIVGELKPFNYTNLFGQNTTFGPVFHKKFLKAALDLQQGIENIKAPYVPWTPEAG